MAVHSVGEDDYTAVNYDVLRYRTLRALDLSSWSSTWGSASLHPRLYASTRYAGWATRLAGAVTAAIRVSALIGSDPVTLTSPGRKDH